MLTIKELKSLKSKKKEYSVSDKDGLSVRIFPNGKKSFQYRYKLPGSKYYKRHTYGYYPELSLKEARKIHSEAVQKVRSGVDLNLEKTISRQEKISEPTVKEAFEDYKTKYLLRRLKKPKFQIGYFEKDILPAIGAMKIKSVTRRHLVAILEAIVERGSPVAANRTLSSMKKFFQDCVEREILEHSPAVLITKNVAGGQEKSRRRFFSETEIKIFWEKVDSAPFSRQAQLVLKLLLLTGQRISELCNAEWEEIDLESKIWTIPEARTKTSIESKVPLSPLAIDCFKELKDLSGNSRFAVQSLQNTKNEKPIRYTAIDIAVSRHLEYFELEKWTPHDLRRTLATQLNELGVFPHVVEKILNHKMQGVMAVYNQAEYWEDKVKALDLWEEKIKRIMAGEKVLEFRKKRA